ncbi:MAG: hypothetical protein PVF85_01795 [Anaerolineales bacterium]|jgi:hypothetical protein
MASFELVPVEKGILRCTHTGEFTSAEVQSLAEFFHDYHGKLLIDLSGTTAEECIRNIKQFRPMMPIAAIFGVPIDPTILEITESYYERPVQHFESEEEALAWLREQ